MEAKRQVSLGTSSSSTLDNSTATISAATQPTKTTTEAKKWSNLPVVYMSQLGTAVTCFFTLINLHKPESNLNNRSFATQSCFTSSTNSLCLWYVGYDEFCQLLFLEQSHMGSLFRILVWFHNHHDVIHTSSYIDHNRHGTCVLGPSHKFHPITSTGFQQR